MIKETIARASEREEVLQNNLDYTLFSWSKQKGIDPICVQRAEGVYLFDYNGKRYIDFSSGLMNVNIGHGDQRVTEAVVRQMQQVSYVTPSCATQVRGELGKKLAEICPGTLNKAFFTLCGASAIENAIKLARLYTGRHKIIARYRAFHGATYAAMTAGGDPRKLSADAQQMPNVIHVEDPFCYRCPWNQEPQSCHLECISHVERVIEFEGPKNIAAILMEGESGSSGCIKYPKNYWKRLREICDQHGILLIADEVMSGAGRCGTWRALEHDGVIPDIMTVAKGLAGGYIPLAATIIRKQVAAAIMKEHGSFMTGHTYSGHTAACAAALAVQRILQHDSLLERVRKNGEVLKARLGEALGGFEAVGDIRGRGYLIGVEFVRDRASKQPFPAERGASIDVARRAFEDGLIVYPCSGNVGGTAGDTIIIAPPYNATDDELLELVEKLSKAVDAAFA